MSLHVHKYGGTSVGDLDRIEAVADRVVRARQEGHTVAVVLSAMAGETDRLTQMGLSLSEHPFDREMDVLLSAGEQVSIALLAIALQSRGVPSRSFLGGQIKVTTDRNHQRAKIEAIETTHLRKSIEAGEVPVIAGFQGVTPEGDITTIGRGGSDTSAVAIAAALEADECRIYTDVDGVYTADPRIVDDPLLLKEVTCEEMLELASSGTKVLHERAVQYAQKYKVPVRVLSSFNDGEGTVVHSDEEENQIEDMEQPVVTGVSLTNNEAKLTVIDAPDVPGVAWQILGPCGEKGIIIDMIVQNTGREQKADFSFTVQQADYLAAMHLLEQTISELSEHAEGFVGTKVVGNEHIAKVTAVGVGMRSHANVATKMFRVLSEENINIQMISTSEIKISVVIDKQYGELAARVLANAFDLTGNIDFK